MPELPEVEVVRRGLDSHVRGRVLSDVQVLHPRAVRRHLAGPADLTAQLEGGKIAEVSRRGKYLWLTVEPPQQDSSRFAVVVHLGMSGQMLIGEAGESNRHKHLRIRAALDDGRELHFVDQRTFGGWMIDDLVPSMAPDDDRQIPASITHIAPDPFDDAYRIDTVVERMRLRHTEIKRALLDQSMVSGIGNIYADEALWLSKIHGQRTTDRLTRPQLRSVLESAQAVMAQALDQGGTSFDSLYVNVNGESGYFERSLNVYGRQDLPCSRCGSPIRRESFMNRSSHFCPKCQRPPRAQFKASGR